MRWKAGYFTDLMIKFGGHAMAAGLSLEEHKFEQFQQRFCDW